MSQAAQELGQVQQYLQMLMAFDDASPGGIACPIKLRNVQMAAMESSGLHALQDEMRKREFSQMMMALTMRWPLWTWTQRLLPASKALPESRVLREGAQVRYHHVQFVCLGMPQKQALE